MEQTDNRIKTKQTGKETRTPEPKSSRPPRDGSRHSRPLAVSGHGGRRRGGTGEGGENLQLPISAARFSVFPVQAAGALLCPFLCEERRGAGSGSLQRPIQNAKKTRVLTKMDQGLVQAELLERGWRVQMVIASAPGNFLSYTFPTLHLPKTISPLACLTFVVCFFGGGSARGEKEWGSSSQKLPSIEAGKPSLALIEGKRKKMKRGTGRPKSNPNPAARRGGGGGSNLVKTDNKGRGIKQKSAANPGCTAVRESGRRRGGAISGCLAPSDHKALSLKKKSAPPLLLHFFHFVACYAGRGGRCTNVQLAKALLLFFFSSPLIFCVPARMLRKEGCRTLGYTGGGDPRCGRNMNQEAHAVLPQIGPCSGCWQTRHPKTPLQ